MEINIVLAMSTFKKAKVVMIPTNEKSLNISPIVLYNKKLFSCYSSKYEYEKAIFQHLYIISDDEIKEGDWFINDMNQIKKCISRDTEGYIDFEGGFNTKPSSCKKIIATTDIKLGTCEYSDRYRESYFNPLPQPSQQFIQKYIEEYNKGNVITDVLVEYENIFDGKEYVDELDAYGYDKFKSILKINPKDNTITIKKVKDSYTREEVENLIYSAMKDRCYTTIDEWKKWIEENL